MGIEALIIGTAVGAALGTATAAASGGNVGKGALWGAAGGAMGGAAGMGLVGSVGAGGAMGSASAGAGALKEKMDRKTKVAGATLLSGHGISPSTSNAPRQSLINSRSSQSLVKSSGLTGSTSSGSSARRRLIGG